MIEYKKAQKKEGNFMFILGLFLGTLLGIIIMAMLQITRGEEDDN